MKIELYGDDAELIHEALERYTRTVAGDVARAKTADEKLNTKLKDVMDLEERFRRIKNGDEGQW